MDNLFVFHGSDHKVGTTMLAQSAAEMIAAGNPQLNVLFVSLSGRKGTEYIREEVWPVDRFKAQIESGVGLTRGALQSMKGRENLYLLGGIENELEEHFYFPETAVQLLEDLAQQFEIMIADTGSDPDNGLAVGGLQEAKLRLLVLDQGEASIARFEKNKGIYQHLGAAFDLYVINQYSDREPYSREYLAKRLALEKGRILRVRQVSYGRQAEMEARSILSYGTDFYAQDICCLANHVLAAAGIGKLELQRKSRWKSFI